MTSVLLYRTVKIMKTRTKADLARTLKVYRARITDWLKGRSNVRKKGVARKLGRLTETPWYIWMASENDDEKEQNIALRQQGFNLWAMGQKERVENGQKQAD